SEDLIELGAVTFTKFNTTEDIQDNFAVVNDDNDAATSGGWIVCSSQSGNLYYTFLIWGLTPKPEGRVGVGGDIVCNIPKKCE
ncbi:MAG: hypothetical protein O4805_03985, partial [Trichodesmium sp. St16_bin2-tuft]|nr:hypothetical protein [Trichodesmium sp. St16_bin2-tuft]